MTKLLPILLFSILLSAELEVDGNLKVTGSVESTTIDSLKAVISELQAQLVTRGGMQLIDYDQSFIVPDGIYTLFVEAWGAGGGGYNHGGGCNDPSGGGGGGYVRAVIQVNPNDSLNFIIGVPGGYGQTIATDGSSTLISHENTILLEAQGGYVGSCGVLGGGGCGIIYDESIVGFTLCGSVGKDNEGGLSFEGTIGSSYGSGNCCCCGYNGGTGFIFITY